MRAQATANSSVLNAPRLSASLIPVTGHGTTVGVGRLVYSRIVTNYGAGKRRVAERAVNRRFVMDTIQDRRRLDQ